jgi:uncharacterized membrane protein YbhN (UPF0104 family)
LKKLGAIVQYVVLLAIAGLLIWFSLRGLAVGEDENKLNFLWDTYRRADPVWLWAMAVVALISHVIRAERWRMLLQPSGNNVGLTNSFLSLMIGYLVNLVVPRGGEVSRCYNLYQLEKTPVEISFGTVVVERIIDLICLLALIGLAFVMEWDKLVSFLNSLPLGRGTGATVPAWAYVAGAGALGVGLLIYLFRNNPRLQKLWKGFREGLVSVLRVRQRALFILYSVMIWALYFVTSFCVLKAFPQTAMLGISAVLTLFALGSIAMAVPLPGGTGSYHTIVPLGLTALYQMPKAEAIAFVFIFHAWQTLLMIVAGVICLLASYWIIRWKRPHSK